MVVWYISKQLRVSTLVLYECVPGLMVNKLVSNRMNSKLYVGGIPYTSTNEDLKAHFSAAGTVTSAQIIIDKMTNRSKGFGFVEMSSDEEAQKAIAMFHDQDFQGRRLTVNVARPLAPREDRPRRAF